MPSEVSICSNALISLGSEPILSLEDENVRARTCKAFYPDLRDTVLRAHPWNFAIRRAQLAQLAAVPVWGFTRQYELPTDPYCLRVLQMEHPDTRFKVEGRQLLCDDDTAKILYVARITNPGDFDSLFTEAFEARLAHKLAMPITRDARLAQLMWQLFVDKLREARSMDGQESPPDPLQAEDLIEVR